MRTRALKVSEIRTDGGTQMRAELNQDVYLEYRDQYLATGEFPPMDVFFDGTAYWLADGFHRLFGAREAKQKTVLCNIHDGTLRDAILFAVAANQRHGLKRSNADKRNAVMTLLNDPEWVKWSDSKIAEQAGVTHPFVASLRRDLVTVTGSIAAATKDEPRKGRDGKEYKRKPEKAVASTEAYDREGESPKAAAVERSEDASDVPESPSAASKRKPSGGATFAPGEWEKPAEEVLDGLGQPVPDGLLDVFRVAPEFAERRNSLVQMKKWINQRRNHPAGVVLDSAYQQILADLNNLDAQLRFAQPHAVCPYCRNELPKLANCTACKGSGWVSEDTYKQAPKGMKREHSTA